MRKLGRRDAGSIIGTLSTGEKILSYPPRGFVVGFRPTDPAGKHIPPIHGQVPHTRAAPIFTSEGVIIITKIIILNKR